MRIGLTYDLRDEYLALGWSEQDVAEFDLTDTIDALETALTSLGHTIVRIGGADALMARLARRERWDLVFNIAESRFGVGRESLVPALLDHEQIPYTFADPLGCALTLDKPMAKRVLRDHGLPTPAFAVVEELDDVENVNLGFPVFAKPAREGSSKGVSSRNICTTGRELWAVCDDLLTQFDGPVLVETFLPGQEVTVGIVGSGARAEVVGVLGVGLAGNTAAYTYDTKEQCESLVQYRLIEGAFAEEARELAIAAYRALGCRDAGRVDLRADSNGRPQIIEVNALPGLHPTHSDLPIMAHLAGWRYESLIGRIIESAQGAPSLGFLHTELCFVRALILHDAIDASARPDEIDALVQADLIRRCLETDGHTVEQYGVTLDLRQAASRIEQADLVFNLVESLVGRGSLIHIVPALVESLRVPMTGCPAHAIAETSNKLTAKHIMRAADLPTPAWLSDEDGDFTPGRWIIKSVWEHASVGLDGSSIVDAHDDSVLRSLIASRRDQLGGLAFAEQFIDGREFNISIIEHDGHPLVLPHAEIIFQDFDADQPHIVSYAAKWNAESFEYNNTPRTFDFAPNDAPLLRSLTHLAQQCWRAFGLRGYARVDFRVDQSGRPWILEVNTNPCLSEDAGFMAAAARAALHPRDVIGRIVQAALRDAAAVP